MCLRGETCLAQHVRSNRDGGPDGGVDTKEDYPEHHAPPYRQVRELQERDREGKMELRRD